ncbi:hydrogenase (NiFe) small subunit HydA [Ruminiclostridium papyrosolvens DSM 2782]|uniref:Hydrogenase (NiFe) small subunit HydA n=1 Tax=Ruminiclostridium papyrosolvens DSM 2782 TaxID=588581 RepID=F1T782_9FIRM|nr:hydrogenase small subunit [Ruminiclostridium papyrosolvens]EGD49330.1 hydrogenase (NiFe) small subunit HydA [Ruminiclostridium papyrosolvens DSM 2782]WES33541.1 hydrogenase small subunit [Ruminiclostridium papyrosolvens DSM 2782]
MNKTKPCPEYTARLETARELLNRVREEINKGKLIRQNLVWLELTGCSGNIISLLNGSNPDFKYLISQMTNFMYDNSLMAAEGEKAMEQLMGIYGKEYILAVEGAVATKNNGMYNIIGRWKGKPVTALNVIKMFGEKASHVIALGACASHGGVSAAKPNPSDSVGVQSILKRKVIKLPGCPCHPDWFMGTLAHILLYGEPELDNKDRPVLFYSTLIHDRCPRRSYFDKGIFAQKLGEKTCMFKLGCRGPVTYIDCPIRKWNQYVNWPIEDDTPCIGCAQFGFPDKMEPFITYNTTREVKE